MNEDRHTGTMLHGEHDANLDLLGRVEQALAGAPRRDAEPVAVKRLALELVVRPTARIPKEESALLPLLVDLLDEDADRALALAYAAF